jgi:predicted amidohydrolase YtcJ
MNKKNHKVIQIPRCYDSHCHIFSTGEVASLLNLRNLKSPQSLAKFIQKNKNGIKKKDVGY